MNKFKANRVEVKLSMDTVLNNFPPSALEYRELGFKTSSFVYSYHSGEYIKRRSMTGYIVYLNNAPNY